MNNQGQEQRKKLNLLFLTLSVAIIIGLGLTAVLQSSFLLQTAYTGDAEAGGIALIAGGVSAFLGAVIMALLEIALVHLVAKFFDGDAGFVRFFSFAGIGFGFTLVASIISYLLIQTAPEEQLAEIGNLMASDPGLITTIPVIHTTEIIGVIGSILTAGWIVFSAYREHKPKTTGIIASIVILGAFIIIPTVFL
ncbi:MAG: YIP1 family protein [Spirochaetia bacterium]